jgi:hypothetical protein
LRSADVRRGRVLRSVEREATRVGSYDLLDDTVQLCVRLAEPASVTLTVGAESTTQDLPAGEHILVITGAETATELGPKHTFTAEQMGVPHVTVARGDTTVLDTDAPLEITPYPCRAPTTTTRPR